MNPRNTVPDVDPSCRPGQDDAGGAIGVIEGIGEIEGAGEIDGGGEIPGLGETGDIGGIGDDAAAGHGAGESTRYLSVHRPLQDIQDIIDKLAAVTQQLRHPGSSLPR
jgi:hypothetical protein